MPTPMMTPTLSANSPSILRPLSSIAIGRGAHGVVDEEIHFLDLFGLDIIFGVEVRHFAGDTRGESVGIESGVILRIPERPAIKASQFLSTPVPNGVTRPRPVTTTLRYSVRVHNT